MPDPKERDRAADDDLIGRTEELARIETELRKGARVISIVGPPGAGKSRLAAHVQASRAPGRVVWCGLEDVTDAARLCDQLARALGIGSLSGTFDEVVRGLGDSMSTFEGLLVVLDNFEQLARHASSTVGVWSTVPGVQLLVTSRERLALPNERLVQIAGLPTNHRRAGDSLAARLFLRSASRFVSTDDLDDVSLEAVEQIATTLAGLPLALEIAATRLRVLGVRELRAHLQEGQTLFDLRTGTRSLRSIIASSWDRAPGPVQETLMRLSVFRGGFTRETAGAVLELDAHDTLEHLQDLVERSLVQVAPTRDRTSRYSMYLVVRQFAEERLEDAGRGDEMRERHARAFTKLAEERLHPTGQVTTEVDNLIAMHQFCLSDAGRARGLAPLVIRIAPTLARDLWLSAPVDLSMKFLDEALAEVPADDPTSRSSIFVLQATVLSAAGHSEEAQALCAEVERLVEEQGAARSMRSRVQLVRGINAWIAGRYAESSRAYRTYLDEVDAAELVQSIFVVCNLAGALIRQGLYDETFDALHEAEALAGRSPDARRDFLLAARWGELARAEGAAGAGAQLERVLGYARAMSMPIDEAHALVELAEYSRETGDLERAAKLLAEARPLIEQTPLSWSPWYLAMARLHEARQEWQAATEAFEQAMAVLRRYRHVRNLAVATLHAAVSQAAAGAIKEAARSVRSAQRLLDSTQIPGSPSGDIGAEQLLSLVGQHVSIATAHARDKRPATVAIPPPNTLIATDIADPRHVAAVMQMLWDPERENETLGVFAIDLSNRSVTLPDGRTIPMGGRSAHWRIFVALGRRYQEDPNAALSADEILTCGWPDDVVRPPSRVYVAISALRRAGLRDEIVRRADGYALAPGGPIVFHD